MEPCFEHSGDDVDRILAEAIELYAESKTDPAIKLFEHLLACHTEHIEEWNLHQFLGMCFRYADRDEEAIPMLEQALKGVGTEPEDGLNRLIILDHLGRTYFSADRFKDSMDCLNRAEQSLEFYTVPEWSMTRYLFYMSRGRCQVYLGKFDQAMIDFRRALAETESWPSEDERVDSHNYIRFEMAYSCVFEGNYNQAAELIDTVDVALLEPHHQMKMHFLVFRTQVRREQYELAMQYFDRTGDDGFGDDVKAEVNYLAGLASFKLNRDDQARGYFVKAQSLPTDRDWLADKCREFLDALDKTGNTQ